MRTTPWFPLLKAFAVGLALLPPLPAAGGDGDKPVEGGGAEITDLIRDLTGGDLAKQRDAAFALERLGPKAAPAVQPLIQALKSNDQHLWYYAARALGSIGPEARAAIPALVDELENARPQRRYRAAHALSRIGLEALPALLEALDARSVNRRTNAARALGWLGSPASRASEKLCRMLASDDATERGVAAEALGRFGTNAVPALREVLRSGDDRARTGALEALRDLGRDAGEALPEIRQAVTSSEPAVRAAALGAFSRAGAKPKELVPRLLEALADGTTDTQRVAEAYLLKLSAEEVLPPLLATLESDDPAAVFGAASTLRRFGSAAGTSAGRIVHVLLRHDERSLLTAIEEALGALGVAAVEPILRALTDKRADAQRQRHLVAALTRIGAPALPALRQGLQHELASVRVGAARALAGLGSEASEAATALADALADEDVAVRAAAARAVGVLGSDLLAERPSGSAGRKIQAAVRGLLDDSDPRARAAALFALSKIEPSTSPELGKDRLRAFIDALEDASAQVRRAAVAAVASFTVSANIPAGRVAESLSALAGSLDDEDRDVRLGAMRVITVHGRAVAEAAPDLVAAVGGWLETRDLEERREAIRALAAIGPAAAAATQRLRAAIEEGGALRLPALEALRAIGPGAVEAAGAVEAVVFAGQDSDGLAEAPTSQEREVATGTLSSLIADPGRLVPILIRAVEEGSEAVRLTAIDALGDIGPPAQPAVPALFKLLDVEYERSLAHRALTRIGPRSIPHLVQALEHKEVFVRVFACSSLAVLGPDAEDAIPALQKARDKDSDERVRDAARGALARLVRRL